MNYCPRCGAQIPAGSAYCPRCGSPVAPNFGYRQPAQGPRPLSALKLAAFILMVLNCIAAALFILPLAWMLPMTISYYQRSQRGIPVSVGFKVCTLIFIGIVPGILMLCDPEP